MADQWHGILFTVKNPTPHREPPTRPTVLVSSLRIDWVDGIEIVLGLLRGVQIYEPNEVRIKMSRSEDHNRQKPDITRKKIVEACVYDDGKKKKARSKGVNLKVRWRAKFAVRYRC